MIIRDFIEQLKQRDQEEELIIYIATTGNWSNYGINSVFSSLEMAQKYVERSQFAKEDDATIKEYKIDNIDVEFLEGSKNLYQVLYNKETGALEQYSPRQDAKAGEFVEQNRKFISVWVFAENEKLAVQIADQRKTEYMETKG